MYSPNAAHEAYFVSWGPFLESPGNLTGPVSYFEIKFSRKVCCVLTSYEAHFVSLAYNFTVPFSKLLKLPSLWKTKQLNGPGNYRELRETGPWALAKWPGGDRVGAEKASLYNLQLQSIFQNLSLGRSETPHDYAVAN